MHEFERLKVLIQPYLVVRRTADQVINASTLTTIVYDSVWFGNPLSEFNTATGIYTAQNPGDYFAFSVATLVNNASNFLAFICHNNDAVTGLGAGISWTHTFDESPIATSGILSLAAGDTLRVRVFHTNVAARSIDSVGTRTKFALYRLG